MTDYPTVDAIGRRMEAAFNVTGWPRWMRRTFILSLPLSVPVYVAAFVIACVYSIVWIFGKILWEAWD